MEHEMTDSSLVRSSRVAPDPQRTGTFWSPLVARVGRCLEEMRSYIESADYAGYDPYDALNSPLLSRMAVHRRWMRIAAIQCLRCCPVNFRPLLGIAKGHNPKALGLFLWGYAKLQTLADGAHGLERIDHLLDLLEALRCRGYSGYCWGYNFDWQSRTVMRPRGTPTLVNTSFIGHALLDCYELTGSRRALKMALSIRDFVLGDLPRRRFGDAFCFSYTPVDTEAIHNANLLGASLLARLTRHGAKESLAEPVRASLRYSMRCQRADGSWFYAETDVQDWIDSFHTGFNLQALRYILDAGLAPEYRAAYRRGVEFYARHFFLDDGTPKYYHDRTYPLDIHAPAQAISFFAWEGREYHDLTDRLVGWMLRHLYSGKGFFYFRQGRCWTNRIPYMRWSQAWAFHALTEYLVARMTEGSP
jgi:hypothetical protein